MSQLARSEEKEKSRYAFITGINGQDGSYLSELLLSKGYKVYGIYRRCSHSNTKNIEHIRERLNLSYGDITDLSGLQRELQTVKEDMIKEGSPRLELYHLAAQSHVGVSFKVPLNSLASNASGTLNVLEAVRSIFHFEYRVDGNKRKGIEVRIYFAATSELFGKVQEVPQTESTPFYPRSPYACSKLYGYWQMINYREAYSMYICNGVLFNHESKRRGKEFVTRKITSELGRVLRGETKCIKLGNLESKRDWSHSSDMVQAMWLILQQSEARDYVLGSGTTHSVREFCEIAFKLVGIDIVWSGSGTAEVGQCADSGKVMIRVDPSFFRPTEVDLLVSDTSAISKKLGWKPRYSFVDLVKCMVKHDCPKHYVGDENIPRNIGQPDSGPSHVVLVTGGSGLVGSAIKEQVQSAGDDGRRFVFLSSKDGDLKSPQAVQRIFWEHRPESVIHLAANVGGLYKNMNHNLSMYTDNLAINQNVLRFSHKYGVKRVLSCLSTCIYPDDVSYPIKEDDLHNGLPHDSNFGYAFAKRLLHIESKLYRDQFGIDFKCVTPTNVFGPNDNFHLENGHVIPALINRCHRANEAGKTLKCYGTGAPLRQFIYSKDLAKLMLMLLRRDYDHDNVTLTPSHEISIKEAAQKIAENVGLDLDDIEWDTTKADGQYKKTAANHRLLQMFPDFEFTPFAEAIAETVQWFKQHYPHHVRQ